MWIQANQRICGRKQSATDQRSYEGMISCAISPAHACSSVHEQQWDRLKCADFRDSFVY